MGKVDLNGRLVGSNEPPYIIAEIGANHNGDIDLAKKLIDEAVNCGVDAVKFQSWSKASIISSAEYAKNVEYSDKKRHFGSLEEMVDAYQLTPDQHRELVSYCASKNVHFLSSAFSNSEIDLLDSLNVPAIKIASMDINNLPMLEYVGSKNRPIILSTGMSTMGEIESALASIQKGGAAQVVLLHCISIYPPQYENINLKNIDTLRRAFDMPVGFSDHSLGTDVPLAAIALGACMIEKHFTLDKNMEGWDHWISADADEMATLCKSSKNIFAALGTAVRKVTKDEIEKRKKFRRRAVIRHPLKEGTILTVDDIDFKRPGDGIHPNELDYLVGRRLLRDYEKDEQLEWLDLA